MDMQNWPKSDWENVYYGLKEISRKMEKIMFECGDDEKAKRFAQDCVDSIDTWLENCKRKGHIEVHTLDLTSSRKPIKSDYHDKEIYKQAFGALLEDYPPSEDIPGGYRVLVDGNYETEFSANSREEAIQKFKDYFANKKKGINNSKKPIKSFRDTSVEDTSNDYGFHWDGDNIYDKDGFHRYFGDYTKDNTGIEPYSSYMQAVKETTDSIRDSFTEDEIPDPEDYAYQLIDFAVETLPDPGKFIKEYEGF